jgi:O-antigen/teichoic acid export membrane protein
MAQRRFFALNKDSITIFITSVGVTLVVEFSSNTSMSDQSRTTIDNFARGAGISTIGRLAGRGIGYLGHVVLARILLPESYGLFALGWTLFRLLTIVSPLGLDNGMIRYGSKYWRKDTAGFRGILIASLLGALVFSVLIGIGMYVFSPWLAVTIFHNPALEKIFVGFAAMIPLATLLRMLVAASSVSQRMICGSVSEDIIQPLAQISIFFGLLKWFDPILSAVSATGLSFAVSLIPSCICVLRQIPETMQASTPSFEKVMPLFRYSLTSVAAITFGVLNIWGDRLIVGYYRPENEVGIYQSVSLIATFLVVALSGVKSIIAPVTAQLYQDGQLASLDELIKGVGKWIMILALPFVLIIVFAPKEILSVILGGSYEVGASTLVVLIFAQFVYVVFGVADQILLMTGHHKDWLLISAGTLCASTVFNIVFIPIYGSLGAAYVSLGASLMVLIASIARIGKLMNIWPYDRRHLKPLVAAIGTGVLLYFVLPMFSLTAMYKLFVTVSISLFAFGGLIVILGIDAEDKELVQAIFMRKRNN